MKYALMLHSGRFAFHLLSKIAIVLQTSYFKKNKVKHDLSLNVA